MNKHIIAEQILRDFSVENLDNLFKGERGHWYAIDTTKKRKSPDSLSEGEWKYRLIYENSKLFVDSHSCLVSDKDAERIVNRLVELDDMRNAELRRLEEVKARDFVAKVFPQAL